MELKEFIKQSIMDIASAVQEANIESNESGINMLVNPTNIYSGHANERSYTMEEHSEKTTRYIEEISFDVAVTTGGEIAGKAGAGINIASIQIGGGGEVSDTHENVSRLKFSIPVALPASEYRNP